MKNRICPDETYLSAYMHDCLSPIEKKIVEEHLIACKQCREVILDTLEFSSTIDFRKSGVDFYRTIKKNKWLLGFFVFFVLSFFISSFFLQFLLISLIMGTKWISEAKNAKNLLMVYHSRDKGNEVQKDSSYFKTNPK